jgi:hypothetical protein
MVIEGIKDLVKHIHLTGLTLNFGFIGMNFAGSSS